MGFLDKLFGPKDWTTHTREKEGYRISCPPDWTVREGSAFLSIHPPTAVTVIDPELGAEIPVPGICMAVRVLPAGETPDVKEILRGRGNIYKDYRVTDHVSSEVPGADRAVVYEFGFTVEGNAFRAVSVIAGKGNRLYDVKACSRADGFDALRKTFRQAIKEFKVG